MRIEWVSEMRITENVSDLHQMRFKNVQRIMVVPFYAHLKTHLKGIIDAH